MTVLLDVRGLHAFYGPLQILHGLDFRLERSQQGLLGGLVPGEVRREPLELLRPVLERAASDPRRDPPEPSEEALVVARQALDSRAMLRAQ